MPFTANEVANELVRINKDYDATRMWNKLYGGVEAAYATQAADVTGAYNQAISEAYSTAERERNAVQMSNLGQGYKAQAYDDINVALREAFNSYQANYQSQMSQINSAEQKALSDVTGALNTDAENVAKLLNTAPEWLQYLYDQYITNAEENQLVENNIFRDKIGFGRFIKNKVDNEDIDIETADLSKFELRDWADIENEITDDNNQLNQKGIDLYDLLFNELGVGTASPYSYQKWLSTYDSELAQWAAAQSPHDVNAAGINFGTVKKAIGLTSTDSQYAFVDRFGGLDEAELTAQFDKYFTQIEDIQAAIKEGVGTNPDKVIDPLIDMVDNIEQLAIKMGIRQGFGESTFDNLRKELEKYRSKEVKNGDIWLKGILTVLGSAGSGAAIGSKGGWVGALIGTAIGQTVGTVEAIGAAQKTKQENLNLEQASKDLYLNLATDLLLYAQTRRAQSQS